MGDSANENAPRPEQVHKAIASLAGRVTQLEKTFVATGELCDIIEVDAKEVELLRILKTYLMTGQAVT